MSLIANIVDPITKENYSRDPRWIARVEAAERWAAHFLGIVTGESAAKVVRLRA